LKKFSDFATPKPVLDGDKVRIDDLVNCDLIDQMREYGSEVPFAAVIRKVNRFYTLS